MGSVPMKLTVDGSGRGNSKPGTLSCIYASASATTESNIGSDSGPTPRAASILFS